MLVDWNEFALGLIVPFKFSAALLGAEQALPGDGCPVCEHLICPQIGSFFAPSRGLFKGMGSFQQAGLIKWFCQEL